MRKGCSILATPFVLLQCIPFRNLPLDLLDHLCQLLLAFLSGLGIHIPPNPLAVGTSGRVFALPEVVVQLVDAAGSGFAVFGFVGLEAALVGGLSLLVGRHLGVGLADLAVDFGRCAGFAGTCLGDPNLSFLC